MMAVNAFIPQYVFSAAVVNNDILAGVLGAANLDFCLLYLLRRSSPPLLALAAAAGLAITAKYTAVILAPVVATALVISLVRSWRHDRRRFVCTSARTLLVVGLASVPLLFWLARTGCSTALSLPATPM